MSLRAQLELLVALFKLPVIRLLYPRPIKSEYRKVEPEILHFYSWMALVHTDFLTQWFSMLVCYQN